MVSTNININAGAKVSDRCPLVCFFFLGGGGGGGGGDIITF